MSKALPYFKWYPGDAETDENFKAFTDAELGFYMRCLNHAWINGGLPPDPALRARSLRVSQKYHDQKWAAVAKCFMLSEDAQRFLNPRQEKERSEALSKSIKATKAVLKRYEKATNVPTDVTPRALARAESESDYGSESVVVEVLKEKKEEDPGFEEFWSHNWRTAGKKPARLSWRKHATSNEKRAVILAAVQRAKPGYMQRELEKRPHMATWLNQERYNDEPESEALFPELSRGEKSTLQAAQVFLGRAM